MKRKKPLNKFVFFLLWIFFSFASILVSYWLVGATTPKDDLPYSLRLLAILQDPFNDYFNDYSPIVMVMAFLLNEIIFGMIFVGSLSAASTPVEMEEETFESVKKKSKSKKTKKHNDDRASTMDLFIDEPKEDEKKQRSPVEGEQEQKNKEDEVSVEALRNKDVEKNGKKNKQEEEERELVMDNDIFLKMFNAGYDMQQLKAMLELTYYIPDVDDIKLQKMFDTSMSPEDIRECIEVYFG